MGRLQQILSAAGNAADAPAFQRPLIMDAHRTGRTQQDHNILRLHGPCAVAGTHRLSGLNHLLNLICYIVCFFPVGILLHIHAVQPHLRLSQRRMGHALIQRFLRSVMQATHLGRHTKLEYIIHRFQHRTAGAEIPAQQHLPPLPRCSFISMGKGCVFFQENAGVCQAELINGLLHIANQEQILFPFCQRAVDGILHRIGVLVFIHHHFPEATADFPGHSGDAATAFSVKQIQGVMLQIAEIQNTAAAFHAVIGLFEPAHQTDQPPHRIRAAGKLLQHRRRCIRKWLQLLCKAFLAGIANCLDMLHQIFIRAFFRKTQGSKIDGLMI